MLSRPLPGPPGSHERPRPRVRAAASALALAAMLAIAGCGGSSNSGGTSADPAEAVPAGAAVYVGADVRPQGAERSNALADGSELTHQADPYLRLLGALRTPGSPALRYQRDIAPWLGPHAGAFLTSAAGATSLLPLLERVLLGAREAASFPFAERGAQGALVLDTSDAAKARSFLDGQATHAGAHAASYRGVSFMASADGVALGVVHDFAVLGSLAAMHAVIDTTLGSPSLAHSSEYAGLLAQAPSGTLAHVYTAAAGASAGTTSGLLALLAGGRQANISLVPSVGSVAVYVDSHELSGTGTTGGLLSSVAEGAHVFAGLPGDSWLAAGLGHLGATLGPDVSALRGLGSLAGGLSPSGVTAPASSTLSVASLIEGLLAPLEALARGGPALTSWMGSGGVFASGTGLLELKGAIVIESTNPAASKAAVARLGTLLSAAGDAVQKVSIPGTDAAIEVRVSGLPLALYVANGRASSGQTKFVLGLGEASVAEALNPSSTLAGSSTSSTAAATLGEGIQPSVIFQVPTLLGLLEGVGLGEDPTLAPVLPLLRGVSTITAGGRTSGGIERFKVVLGLAGAG